MQTLKKSGFVTALTLLIGVTILSILLVLNLEKASDIFKGVQSSLKGVPEISKSQGVSILKEASNQESDKENVNITATFEIITNGTKRIFTDSRYHNKSQDVYIEASNPSLVHVKKKGITWNDFFKTLPMQLDSTCLLTGTGQTFCSGEGGILRFYINNQENTSALALPIENGDLLEIVFGK